MTKAEILEQVREKFKKDRFATLNGVVVEEVQEGYARCGMEIEERHLNAAGIVMGGAVFTIADFAFAVASNWNKPLTVSLTSQISFLGAAKGSYLTAEARVKKEGRTTCYYEIEVFDDRKKLVAAVTINGFNAQKGE